MAQYRQCKNKLPTGTILLFRLGDFYEMFFEDAKEASSILNVALTKRGEIPMCGIPYHATGNYMGKLLQAGRKVAICDQIETARPGQLVKRDITQIISPGAHFDERMLKAERNNFLVALLTFGEGWHNNHHHFPGSAKQGFYWWEIDITYYLLKILSFFGIIWDIRTVSKNIRESNKVKL